MLKAKQSCDVTLHGAIIYAWLECCGWSRVVAGVWHCVVAESDGGKQSKSIASMHPDGNDPSYLLYSSDANAVLLWSCVNALVMQVGCARVYLSGTVPVQVHGCSQVRGVNKLDCLLFFLALCIFPLLCFLFSRQNWIGGRW